MFFGKTKSKSGCQSLENQLNIFKGVQQPWNTGLNNDEMSILLKKTFFNIFENLNFDFSFISYLVQIS